MLVCQIRTNCPAPPPDGHIFNSGYLSVEPLEFVENADELGRGLLFVLEVKKIITSLMFYILAPRDNLLEQQPSEQICMDL